MNGSLYFPPHLRRKTNSSDFLPNGRLRTRIFWQCTTRIMQKAYKIVLDAEENEIRKYYTFTDEWGCPFSAFEQRIGDSIHPGNDYQLEGEICVSKGSTYLSIRKVRFPNGQEEHGKDNTDCL